MCTRNSLAFVILLAALGKASFTARQESTIQWGSCVKYAAPVQCANFSVPLDHADASKGTITLLLARHAAPIQPSQGTLFLNPGGPGGSGVDAIGGGFPVLRKSIGNSWDLVSWDPRGVGGSMPNFVSFDNEVASQALLEDVKALGNHGNLTLAADVDKFLSSAPAFDGIFNRFDSFFVGQDRENLKYIGTAAVVRDLVLMADAISGAGSDINYWGISYGTVVGYQLTQMFSDRVGKIILDGVLAPEDYNVFESIFGYDTLFADIEKTWTVFLRSCAAAGALGCPLVNERIGVTTEQQIRDYIDNELDFVFASTEAQARWSDFINLTRQLLYTPGQWLQLAQILSTIRANAGLRRSIPNSPTPWLIPGFGPILPRQEPVLPSLKDQLMIVLIWCGDSADPGGVSTPEVLDEVVRVSQNVTNMFGSVFMPPWICHRWKTRAVERYTGPWNKPPKNEVLVIGNMADPVTPFRGAQLITTDAYLGSKARLLQQVGPGHGSSANNSTCTENVIQAYLQGNLPVDAGNDDFDVKCDVDTSFFGLPWDLTWETTPSEDRAFISGPNDPGLLEMLQDRGNSSSSENAGMIVWPGATKGGMIAAVLSLLLAFV